MHTVTRKLESRERHNKPVNALSHAVHDLENSRSGPCFELHVALWLHKDIMHYHVDKCCGSAPEGVLVSTTMVGVDGLFGGDFMEAALRRLKLPSPTEKEAWSPPLASLMGGKACKERLKKLLLALDWLRDGDWGGEGDSVQCSELPDSCSCGSNSSSERIKGSSFGRFTVNSTLVQPKKKGKVTCLAVL